MPKVYLSATHRKDEFDVIRATHHEYVLLSFALNGHKTIQDFIDKIGFKPKSIIVDPGVATFSNRNTSTVVPDIFDCYPNDNYTDRQAALSLLEEVKWLDSFHDRYPFHAYIQWVLKNRKHIDYVLAFDDMYYLDAAHYCYQVMKHMNLGKLVPIFQYGNGLNFKQLDEYVQDGNELIALGGTLKEPKINKRIEWVRACIERYPNQPFHFLGTQSKKAMKDLPGLYSCDGNAWKLTASRKDNRTGGETKVEASIKAVQSLQDFIA